LKKLLIFPALFIFLQSKAQPDWKQSLRYDLHVKFNPTEKSLDAGMKLQYINHSPDTLSFIWFHIWPNAYRNDRTRYSDQLLENGDTRFYFSSKEQKGYLNRLDFRVNGTGATIQDHPEFIDVVKLILPKPLFPGDSISVSASFHLRLPYNFNGNGYEPHHVELRNWYPEPAVYDTYGWHPMPFLVQGGAYHEAGDFTVEIEAPPAYLIAAGAAADTLMVSPESNRYRFSIKNANSFAWIADTKYKLKKDTMEISPGRTLVLQYFYTLDLFDQYKNLFAAAKNNILQLSAWLSPYPHQTLSFVQAAPMEDQNFSGLISMGAKGFPEEQKAAVQKALVAQWFQTMLMSDQRNQPWLSRGFIHYYNKRLNQLFPPANPHRIPFPIDILWLRVAENEKTTQPVRTPAPEFSVPNDSLMPATKAGFWIAQLQDSIGIRRFDQNMSHYFSYWKFGHPYPVNFEIAMDTNAGKNLKPEFDKLKSNISLFPAPQSRTLKPAYIFSARNSERYNYIGLAPVLGYNKYDDFMLGAVIHNINLPENKFEFLITPLYAFGSKELVGLGRLSYTWHPENHFSRIIVGLNGAHFNTNKATDSTGQVLFEYYSKLVPYIRVDFKPSNPRSSISKWMDFRTYLIREQSFGQYELSPKDSLLHPNSVHTSFRYVNQLSLNLQDGRTLYPYVLRVEFQQSELFYRINLIANYFLNYPEGGGLKVRFFAAKFGAWDNTNNLDLSRYEPQLLGVDGEQDYLYEDYFIGRSATYAQERSSVSNQGYAAQQIMNRDGGLKLRINDIDFLQGKSADWVTSFNFNTTLPARLFPFPVPLRIFFDVGTYAEAWGANPLTSHFLYTGGIQLSLFKNVLNIYAPLIYSSDFNQALTGTNFGRRITFSIDIQNINYKGILKKRLPIND
jgi:hypothetical protein